MDVFTNYLARIQNQQQRDCMAGLLQWMEDQFPKLTPRLSRNQPVYTSHGTFIIGFARARHYLSVVPEPQGIAHFRDTIESRGYSCSNEQICMRWDMPLDYHLLEALIRYNLKEKAGCHTFWRTSRPS